MLIIVSYKTGRKTTERTLLSAVSPLVPPDGVVNPYQCYAYHEHNAAKGIHLERTEG